MGPYSFGNASTTATLPSAPLLTEPSISNGREFADGPQSGGMSQPPPIGFSANSLRPGYGDPENLRKSERRSGRRFIFTISITRISNIRSFRFIQTFIPAPPSYEEAVDGSGTIKGDGEAGPTKGGQNPSTGLPYPGYRYEPANGNPEAPTHEKS